MSVPGAPDLRPVWEKLFSRAQVPAHTTALALANILGEGDELTARAESLRQDIDARIAEMRAKAPKPSTRKKNQ